MPVDQALKVDATKVRQVSQLSLITEKPPLEDPKQKTARLSGDKFLTVKSLCDRQLTGQQLQAHFNSVCSEKSHFQL